MSIDDASLTWDIKKRSQRGKAVSYKIRELASGRANNNVLEYGCGTGLVSFNLSDCFKNFVLMDSSPETTSFLQEQLKKAEYNTIKAMLFDFTKDTYEGELFNSNFAHRF